MRLCAVCEASLDGRRADCRTCTDRCRTALWRARAASAAANAPRKPPKPSVTVREGLVALTAFADGPCPDANRCRHYMRFSSGPWTCERCHPRVRGEWGEAA
jgi:hypothetical protein